MHDDYIRRWAKRYRAYCELGGRCEDCGETSPVKLDFHHLDRRKKDIGICQLTQHATWAAIKKELRKCILLCRNCHVDRHFEESGNKALFQQCFSEIKRKAKELDKISRPRLDWERIYALLKEGKTLIQIAHLLHKDVSTIREIAFRLQQRTHEKLYLTRDEYNREKQKIDPAKLLKLYSRGKSVIEMAQHFKCATSTIYAVIARLKKKKQLTREHAKLRKERTSNGNTVTRRNAPI